MISDVECTFVGGGGGGGELPPMDFAGSCLGVTCMGV